MNTGDKLTITPEDEKAVQEKLQSFTIKKREEPEIIRLSPTMLSAQETLEGETPTAEEAGMVDISEKITENSFSPNYNIVFYKYSSTKKFFDFLAGFITVYALYCFLNFQPLVIFLIFFIGSIETVLAFKSNRMYIVWGFVWGSIFSTLTALFLSLVLIYFPSSSSLVKMFMLIGK